MASSSSSSSSSSRATPADARARDAREVVTAVRRAVERARAGTMVTRETTRKDGDYAASMTVTYARLGGGVERAMRGDVGARVVLVRAMIVDARVAARRACGRHRDGCIDGARVIFSSRD
jgi:hypothetical protein